MTIEMSPTTTGAHGLGTGLVIGTSQDDLFCTVLMEDSPDAEGRARVPTSLPLLPRVGDRVLVAWAGTEELFVLSVLQGSSIDASGPNPRCSDGEAASTLRAPSGSSAEVREDGSLVVRDRKGELIFEYDEAAGTSRVRPQGHLDIDVPAGLSVRTGGKIRFESRTLEIESARAWMGVEEMKYEGKRFQAALTHARLSVGRLETLARTVISRATNVYAKVTELSQLRTGRRRVLVDSRYEMRAESANLRSKKDFKIDGEQIELG